MAIPKTLKAALQQVEVRSKYDNFIGGKFVAPDPAHTALGGYKQSGIGRENHRMMLDHCQQTKNLLVSGSPKAMGFL